MTAMADKRRLRGAKRWQEASRPLRRGHLQLSVLGETLSAVMYITHCSGNGAAPGGAEGQTKGSELSYV